MKFEELYQVTKNQNILYIEDDKNFLKETADIFNELFQTVDIASNGMDGYKKYLEYYEKHQTYYDIVITDINMPKLDGIGLTKQIYKINSSQSVIVVSAYNDSKYLLEFVNLGIEHFFIKPLDFDKVLSILYQISSKISDEKQQIDTSRYINLAEDYVWDVENSYLTFKNSIVKLTKNETQLMKLFIKNKMKVSGIEEIQWALEGLNDGKISIETLKPMISRLRKKIPLNKIENIYSLGYKLIF